MVQFQQYGDARIDSKVLGDIEVIVKPTFRRFGLEASSRRAMGSLLRLRSTE